MNEVHDFHRMMTLFPPIPSLFCFVLFSWFFLLFFFLLPTQGIAELPKIV